MKISEYIWLPLSLLGDASGLLTSDGTWWLRDYEKKLIEVASRQLDPENKAILAQQMRALFYVQRLNQGRTAHIHFHLLSRLPRMILPDDYGLAQIKVKSTGGSTWVSVGTANGHIFFLLYKKPPKPIFAHPFEVEKIKFGGKADISVIREIHNEEHGEDEPI